MPPKNHVCTHRSDFTNTNNDGMNGRHKNTLIILLRDSVLTDKPRNVGTPTLAGPVTPKTRFGYVYLDSTCETSLLVVDASLIFHWSVIYSYIYRMVN